jgi:mitogen-activated protein kinase organizer 1
LLPTQVSGHGWEVLDVDVMQDNSKIASCGGDKTIFVWDVASAKILKRLRGTDRIQLFT